MKILYLSLIVLFCGQLNGQRLSSSSSEDDKRSVFLSLGFSPDLNYRYITSTSNDAIMNQIIGWRNSHETPRIGYTANLNLSIFLSDRTSLETGFGYRDMGYTTLDIHVIKGSSEYIGNLIDHFYSYNIPFVFRQTLGKRKWQLSYHVGMSANFFNFQKTVIVSVSDPTQVDIIKKNMDGESNYSKINLTTSMGLGATYSINPKSKISIEPTVRYSVISVTQNTPIKGYLFNAGLNLTYQLKLN